MLLEKKKKKKKREKITFQRLWVTKCQSDNGTHISDFTYCRERKKQIYLCIKVVIFGFAQPVRL